MSRSYTEDWERKKSYLIRSLFHDIPFRALSPVPECLEETHDGSTHSSETELPQESISSLEVYSESEATISDAPPDPVPPSCGVHTTLLTRPYSPLPPLIIEGMPNRHDEPPEYYRTLLAKIRLIYRKIFIEGKTFSDIDLSDSFDSSNEIQTIVNEDIEMAGSLSELSEENRSFSSDGYSADTETSDNEESIGSNLESIEVVNDYKRQTAGSLDTALQSNTIEENANNSNNKFSDLNIEEIARESFVSEEEADYRQIATQADVHIDGAQLAAIRPSPVYEEPRIQVTPMVVSDAVTLTRSPEELLSDNLNTTFKEPSLETQLILEATQISPSTQVTEILVNEEVSPESVSSLTCEDPRANVVQYLMETAPLEARRSTSEDMATSPILPFTRRYRSPDIRGSQATLEASEDQDANHRHAIVESEIHGNSSPDAQVSKHTQKQAFVLRFSKTTEHSFVQEKKRTDVDVQETTPSTEESGNLTNNQIEVIRTRQPDASIESIPIDTTRLTSDMDLTCERVDNTLRDISNVTSTSQDGCHNITADPKTSCDIANVLASIFNNSSQENMDDISKESSARKRSYEEMSVQAETVRWNDLRANFFVGTPKIFRLCSCVDHVCN